MFFRRAAPPVSTKPISTKSADSSGGVFSRASLIPPKICVNTGFKASAVSSSFKDISFGVPDLISLPFIRYVFPLVGTAVPISFLIFSALASPTNKLNCFLI